MSTDTATKPRTSHGGGGTDDPLVHSLPPGVPVKPGVKAYCGTRIKGVHIPNTAGYRLCVVCEAMRKDGGRLPGLNV